MDAQRAYSDFIYHTAWYEFEFMPWIRKTWNASNSNGSSWLRKWERTLFFTLEFSFKAGYAQLIGLAAKANYEEPVTDIFLLVSTKDPVTQTNDIKVIKEQDHKKLLGISRWGAFTKSIIELSNKDIQILEIGGNNEIVVSVLLNKVQQIDFKNMELLYESAVVTNDDLKRLVCLLPVNELLPFVRYAKNNAIELEHVFDY
jgi:hypothetical protein